MNRREVDRTSSAPPPFPRETMHNARLPSTTCCTPSTTSQCHFLSHIESLLQCRNHMAGLFSTHLLQCAQDRTGSCERATLRRQIIMLQAPGANAETLREYLSPFKAEDLHLKGCSCFLGVCRPLSASPGGGIELAFLPEKRDWVCAACRSCLSAFLAL